MNSNVKSLRLEDRIASRLTQKDLNFSSLANQAIEEYLTKHVWVPNMKIEQFADISASLLWKRVAKIQFLRTSSTAVRFCLYPTSQDVINMNKNIHAYANGDFNVLHDGFVYFNVQFPINLYLFLSSKKWADVERFIHGFLAFLYWGDESKQHLMQEQLEKKTLKSVIKIVSSTDFENLATRFSEYNEKAGAPSYRETFNKTYYELLLKFGVDPIMFPYLPRILDFLNYPFSFNKYFHAKSSELNITLKAGYMRDIYEETDDWKSIVVSGKDRNDGLHRAESTEEPWKMWSQDYAIYHSLDFGRRRSSNK